MKNHFDFEDLMTFGLFLKKFLVFFFSPPCYPITICVLTQREQMERRPAMEEKEQISPLSRMEFLEKSGINKTFLTYHNLGSSVPEVVEIGMPYMIMYEALDREHDRMTALEFTESRKYYAFSSLEELDRLEPRPLHSHNFYELTIVLSGEVRLQIENEIVTYGAGECCLCNRNIHHKELHDTDFEIVLFMFREEYIRSVLEQDTFYDEKGNAHIRETFFHHLFRKNGKEDVQGVKEYVDFRVKENYDPNVFFRLLNAILMEISADHAGKNHMIRGYFCRFIALLNHEASYQIRFHRTKPSKEEVLFYEISQLLEGACGRIGRRELEEKLNYNSDYLNRIVKKNTGKTLSEYGRVFLLREAARLLRDTDKKVGEICEELGYRNRSFFNRMFAQEYGMTPTEYRRKMR